MSSDGAQTSMETPGFVYILKIGGYQHVLRPADRKASDDLAMAQTAISNIDLARSLLNERGPFLLAERQQNMDEFITATEEAIDRVVRLLVPARVEQISDDSIRVNTKNAWVLQSNEAKAAATFSRLHISHNRLQTVLHDLNNIEATAQLESCEARATTVATSSPVRSPQQPHSQSQPQPQPRPETHPQTPASQRDGLTRISTLSSQHSRGQGSIGSDISAPDDHTDVSHERLPIIHELDATSIALTKPIDLGYDARTGTALSMDLLGPGPHAPGLVKSNVVLSAPSESSGIVPNLQSTSHPVQAPKPNYQTVPVKPNHTTRALDRETFSRYRKRNRDARQEPKANMSAPITTVTELATRPSQYGAVNDTVNQERSVTMEPRFIQVANLESMKAPHITSHSPQAEETATRSTANIARSSGTEAKGSGTRPGLTSQSLQTSVPTTPSQILSPSRTQLSPQAQTPSSGINSPVSILQPQSSVKTHEIVWIDKKLTRLPSLLQAGSTGRPKLEGPIPPYPASDTGSDNESMTAKSAPAQHHDTVERSVTASPAPQPGIFRSTNPPLHGRHHSHNDIHHRSHSDTTVPRINVTRAPTIPRKPLPYRNIALAGGSYPVVDAQEHGFEDGDRSGSQFSLEPRAVSPSQQGTSGPPSPIGSDLQRSLRPQHSTISFHSLSVQGASSSDASRRSSVSVDVRSAATRQHSARPQISAKSWSDPVFIPDGQRFHPPVAVPQPFMPQTHQHGPSQGKDRPPEASEPPLSRQPSTSLDAPNESLPNVAQQVQQFRQGPTSQQYMFPSGQEPQRPNMLTQQTLPLQASQAMPNPLKMHPISARVQQPSAYQAQSASTIASQPQSYSTPVDYRSPAYLQMRHFVPSSDTAIPPSHPRAEQQHHSRFRDQDQASLSFAQRSRTVPEPNPSLNTSFLEHDGHPRRASEQDHSFSSRLQQMVPPAQSQPKPNPPRPQVQRIDVTAQSPRQIAIPVEGPVMIPVQASPRSRDTADPLSPSNQLQTSSYNTEPSAPALQVVRTVSKKKKNQHDRELFGRHRWGQPTVRPSISEANPQLPAQELTQIVDTGPPMQLLAQSHTIEQQPDHIQQRHQKNTSLPSQQRWHQEQEETARRAQHSLRHPSFDDGLPHIRLTPLHEGQAQQLFSSTYKSIDIPTEQEVQAEQSQHVKTVKKRSSWLSHQASKLSRERR